MKGRGGARAPPPPLWIHLCDIGYRFIDHKWRRRGGGGGGGAAVRCHFHYYMHDSNVVPPYTVY